ncbi:MAG TPA: hypothetical protein GXX17_06045 [Clostridiales bacterium]|nr:hypothetical protein [Clostridiales bacterium]
MQNKQHEFILRAFVESKIPCEIKNNAPELIALDTIIGGYCTQIIKKPSTLNILKKPILSAEEKNVFTSLINNASGKNKEELVLYYRLAILAESIILQYADCIDGIE